MPLKSPYFKDFKCYFFLQKVPLKFIVFLSCICFYLNSSADNSMGKICVVFIENSNYQSFPSIEGPAKDVALMKNVLSSYEIDKIVHKKNLTKLQIEKFFSSELKEIVLENKIQSIMIWYAGHGKYINDKGYWIPIDAERDDESSYFNNTSLKASLKSYSKEITHILMVTDACKSGPSFYQAMRDNPVIKDCASTAAELKSSQIFASSGYELALKNSLFTETFAKTLSSNNTRCIPIEKVVKEVTKMAVIQNGVRPRFGTILDLEHKEGTFFFIRK